MVDNINISKFKAKGKTRTYQSGAKKVFSALKDEQEREELLKILKAKGGPFEKKYPESTKSPNETERILCKAIDTDLLLYDTQLYNALLSKSLRNVIYEIIDTVGVENLKIVFDDKVFKRFPKDHNRETGNIAIFSHKDNAIVVPRIVSKYKDDENAESYQNRIFEAKKGIGKDSDINTYIEVMPTTFAHEFRHFWQAKKQNIARKRGDSIKSIIIRDRAIEADASTFSALAMWELKEKNNLPFFDNYKKSSDGDIFEAFEKTAKNGDILSATQQAFVSWYESTRVSIVDNNISGSDFRKNTYENNIVKNIKVDMFKDKYTFDYGIDISNLLKKLSINNKLYLSDMNSFLLKKENIGIKAETAKEIEAIFSGKLDYKTAQILHEQLNEINNRGNISTNQKPKENILNFVKIKSR
ncbi:MAG: DUF6782 family putative metallopeptidase [Alphaproteobacteria bacterium]